MFIVSIYKLKVVTNPHQNSLMQRRGPCGRSGRRRNAKKGQHNVALETTDFCDNHLSTKIIVKNVDPSANYLTTRSLKPGQKIYLLHCSNATGTCHPECHFEMVIISIQQGHEKQPRLSDALTHGRDYDTFCIFVLSYKQLCAGPVVFTAKPLALAQEC